MRKTSADTAEVYALPVMQSADLPVRPFGAEPAEPALAHGAPPDGPRATPARALTAFSAMLLLFTAVPVAAGHGINKAKHRHSECRGKAKKPVAAAPAPAKKVALPTTVVLKSPGGGSGHWMPIASDLMP